MSHHIFGDGTFIKWSYDRYTFLEKSMYIRLVLYKQRTKYDRENCTTTSWNENPIHQIHYISLCFMLLVACIMTTENLKNYNNEFNKELSIQTMIWFTYSPIWPRTSHIRFKTAFGQFVVNWAYSRIRCQQYCLS